MEMGGAPDDVRHILAAKETGVAEMTCSPVIAKSNGNAIPIAMAKLLMTQVVIRSNAPWLISKGEILWTLSPPNPALLMQNATSKMTRRSWFCAMLRIRELVR